MHSRSYPRKENGRERNRSFSSTRKTPREERRSQRKRREKLLRSHGEDGADRAKERDGEKMIKKHQVKDYPGGKRATRLITFRMEHQVSGGELSTQNSIIENPSLPSFLPSSLSLLHRPPSLGGDSGPGKISATVKNGKIKIHK